MLCMGYIVVGSLALACSYNYFLNLTFLLIGQKKKNLGLILKFTFIHLITECTLISTARAVYQKTN